MKKVLFCSLLLLVLFFQGCNEKPKVTKNTQLITDMTGRKVYLPKDVKKIVSFGSVPMINALLLLMGEGDKIISALPPWANKPKWKYQYEFLPKLKTNLKLQGRGMAFDEEGLIKAKPDVVFVMTFSKSLVDVLEPKGVKVVVLKCDNAKDLLKSVELLGQIFNKSKRAKAYKDYFLKTLAFVKTKTARIKHKKRVLYTRFHNLSQPVLMAEWWIKQAGGVSVTDNGRTNQRFTYSLEDLLSFNPDLIIFAKQNGLKLLLKQSRLSSLKAVKTHSLYVSPSVLHIWSQPGVHAPVCVLWALHTFYPKLYSKSELLKDVGYFYKHFFNKNFNKKTLLSILEAKNDS